MIKTLEDISRTKKRIKIEIPADAIEDEIKSTLAKLRTKAKMPGFRPGKAPISLIEKRFGKEAEAEAVEKVIPRFYADALKESDLTPISMPEFEGGMDYKRNEPLSLTMVVETRPKIDGLNYEGMKVKAIPTNVDDQEVEDTLRRLSEDKAVYEPYEGPVGEGNLVIMDIETLQTSKTFKDEVFKVGSDYLPLVFTENLSGMNKGEVKEFEAEFPADFHKPEFAGLKEGVRVTVKEVKTVSLPALDDEFAKDLNFDNMDSLKAGVREKLQERKNTVAAKIMKASVIRSILDAHDFEAPESMLNEELRLLVANAMAMGRKEGEEALRNEYRPQAERNVKATILLQIIGEKEGIEATDEDVNRRVLDVAGQSGLSPENVMKYYISRDGSLDGLRHSVYEDKVLGLLVERAVIEEGGQ